MAKDAHDVEADGGSSGFAVPPAAVEAASRKKLKRHPVRAVLMLLLLAAGAVLLYRYRAVAVALLDLPVAPFGLMAPRWTRLDPTVLYACLLLGLVGLSAVLREQTFVGRLRRLIASVEDGFSKHVNDEFHTYLVGLCDRAQRNTNPRLVGIYSRLVVLADAIDPFNYLPRTYRPLNVVQIVTPLGVYQSRLLRTADTLVRLALLLTFATLTWALVNAVAQLPDFEAIAKQGSVDANATAAQTSKLVSDLIAAASFKFAISAFGIGLAIVLRLIAAWQERAIVGRAMHLCSNIAGPINAFLHDRASGTIVRSAHGADNIQDLMRQLVAALHQNTEVNREIARFVMASPQR